MVLWARVDNETEALRPLVQLLLEQGIKGAIGTRIQRPNVKLNWVPLPAEPHNMGVPLGTFLPPFGNFSSPMSRPLALETQEFLD